jgi:hypothetical protein
VPALSHGRPVRRYAWNWTTTQGSGTGLGTGSPPPASKASSLRCARGGRMECHGLGLPPQTFAANTTGRPSPMAFLVGVMGPSMSRTPPPNASSGLARVSHRHAATRLLLPLHRRRSRLRCARGGRTQCHGLGLPSETIAASATGRPSPMALLVGVEAIRVAAAPPPDASSGLARPSSVRHCRRWPVQTADASPSPLVRSDGAAVAAGGGAAHRDRTSAGLSPASGHLRASEHAVRSRRHRSSPVLASAGTTRTPMLEPEH